MANEYPQMEFEIHDYEDHAFVTIYDHDWSYSDWDPSSYDFTIDYESIFDDTASYHWVSYDGFEYMFEEFMNKIIEKLCWKFYDFTQIWRWEWNFYSEWRGVDELEDVKWFSDGVERIRSTSNTTIKELRINGCNSDIFRDLVNYMWLAEKIRHYEKIFNYNIPDVIRSHLWEKYQRMPEEDEVLTDADIDNIDKLLDRKILDAWENLVHLNKLKGDYNYYYLAENLGLKDIIFNAYNNKENHKIPKQYENEFIDKMRELRLRE